MSFLSAICELDTVHVTGGFISAVQGGEITSLCLAEDASFQLARGTFFTSARRCLLLCSLWPARTPGPFRQKGYLTS